MTDATAALILDNAGRAARRYFVPSDDADEASGEAVLRQVRKFADHDPAGLPLESWLDIAADFAARLYRDRQHARWARLARIDARRRGRKPFAALFADRRHPPPDAEPERRDFAEAALRKLCDLDRDIVRLHLWGGLEFKEVGARLGYSMNHCWLRYRNAVWLLRDWQEGRNS